MFNFFKNNIPLLAYQQNPKLYDYIFIDNKLYINKSNEKLYIFNGIDKSKLVENTEEVKDNTVIYFLAGDGEQSYKNVLDFIIKNSTKKHVLLADGGDGTIYPYDIPNNILHVYCPNFRFTHSKYSPFPRGILLNHYNEYLKLDNENIERNKWIYCNFNLTSSIRQDDFYFWKKQELATTENNINQQEFFRQLYKHKFNICTIGNGSILNNGYPADTYRLYETIICGGIPIAKKHNLNNYLKDDLKLPIYLVDSWEEVTLENLQIQYEILSKNFNPFLITEQFWIEKLRKHFN